MASEESKRIRAAFVNDPDSIHTPIEVRRREWEAAALQTPLPPDTTIDTVNANGIHCERVCAPGVDDKRTLLFVHGGGFTSGSCKTHRDLASRLSSVTRIAALTVDYALAPEYPFPHGLEDMVNVYRWLLEQGTPPEHIVVSGDSAGGGLAVSMLLALRDNNIPLPRATVLLSPWLDLALTGQSMVSRTRTDPLVSYAGLSHAAKLYLGDQVSKAPLASPIYADLRGLPPMLIHVGDHELLLSDSMRLADRARAAGVDVQLIVWSEMWHVFHSWAAELPEAQQAIDQIGQYVHEKLDS